MRVRFRSVCPRAVRSPPCRFKPPYVPLVNHQWKSRKLIAEAVPVLQHDMQLGAPSVFTEEPAAIVRPFDRIIVEGSRGAVRGRAGRRHPDRYGRLHAWHLWRRGGRGRRRECLIARAPTDEPIDVASELAVRDAETAPALFVDGLERPAGVEFSCDLREVGDERDAAYALHRAPIRCCAHESLRL